MSEAVSERLELLRAGIEGFNRGDPAPALAMMAEDVECVVGLDLMNAGTFVGHDGYLRMIESWGEAWDSVNAEVIDVQELPGDYLLAEILQRAVGVGSGVPVEMTIWWLFGFAGREVRRFHLYASRAAAVTVAGE